ncbi:MAG: hypothetical protein HY452_00480 [Parcubacteria group bacterium]|nr:hypothetical protein [Parcubacteria group bacterium]
MTGRLYVSANFKRIRIHDMNHGELVDRVQEIALEELGLKIPKKFFRQFTPTVLYRAMRRGKGDSIFTQWQNERAGVPF